MEKLSKRRGKTVDDFVELVLRLSKSPRSRQFVFSTFFSTTFSPIFAVEKWKTLQNSRFYSNFPHTGRRTFSTSNPLCFPRLLPFPLREICGEFFIFPHTFQHLWKTCGEVGGFRNFVACGRRPRRVALIALRRARNSLLSFPDS